MHPIPPWLTTLSAVSLAIAGLCALGIAIDEFAGRRQKMWIMNVVWPVTALWSGPLGLVAYVAVGRAQSLAATRATRAGGDGGENGGGPTRPFWQTVGVAATHCGSGCALADLTVEWAVVALPVTFFGSQVFGAWLADFVAAFLIGILFQYFTIAPMRHLSVGDGILAAVKADALSLTSWQLGMYGWMAIALFALFSTDALPKTEPAFWFMMQLAMCAGFLTAYPVNWWLLRAGIKEKM